MTEQKLDYICTWRTSCIENIEYLDAMGSKARKTRKFAEVKRVLNPKDLKSKQ